MLVCEAIDGWLLAKSTEVRASTIKRYTAEIRTFRAWPECPADLSDVTTDVIRRFIRYCQEQDWQPVTLDTRLVLAKGFIVWCLAEGLIVANPWKHIRRQRVPQNERTAYTKDEVKAIFAACESERDRLIVRMLTCTAMRRQELCGVQIGDIDFAGQTVLLHMTKGGDERRAYLDKYLASELWRFCKSRLTRKEAFLFVNRYEQPLTGSAIQNMCARLSKRTGIRVFAHRFRHTAITWLLEAGLSMEIVRQVSGHKTYEVLRRYVHLQPSTVREAVEANSPLRGL